MKNTIDKMSRLYEKHNISLPEGIRKTESRDKNEYYERFHAEKDGFSNYHCFLIDLGASNHMVSSKESFSSLNIYDGPSIHMEGDTKIQVEGKGTIKLEHGVLKMSYMCLLSSKSIVYISYDSYRLTKVSCI